jgi:UDP-glucose 4-epimerase
MSRVLVTGGAGGVGAALVRRLLADPAYEVRVSDARPAPQWMREGCEIHAGDLRVPREARKATASCTHVVHLAADGDGSAGSRRLSHTLLEADNARCDALLGAALQEHVERFVYVSSAAVFERAEEFPTTEAHLRDCPPPRSADGFSMLAGETHCRAAHAEHGLPYTICRPCDSYGADEPLDGEPGGVAHALPDLLARALAGRPPLPVLGSGEQTRTPTHVRDVADGLLAAMRSPRGCNEDFNIAAARELTLAAIARIAWETCGDDPAAFALEHLPPCAIDVQRRWPAVEKARELLGWQAEIGVPEGLAATVERLRQRGSIGSPA